MLDLREIDCEDFSLKELTQDCAFSNVPLCLATLLILYMIHSKQLKTHLWVVVHALRWPSPVHHLLWFDATLCGNCHTLH
jgi:hypothetical protein